MCSAKPFTIIYQPSAEKALRKLPHTAQVQVTSRIEALALAPLPPGSKKLKAPIDLWRIRIGHYRVVYTVRKNELLVLVLKVGHRKDIYRGLE